MANYINTNRYLTEEIDVKDEKTIIFDSIESQKQFMSEIDEDST